MNYIFITVLNMSVTASIVAVFVIFARLLLKKAPKIFSYALWAVVLFRMLCPFSFESIISILPIKQEVIQVPVNSDPEYPSVIESNVTFMSAVGAAYHAVGDTLNGGLGTIPVSTDSAPDGVTFASHLEVWIIFGSYIWLIGIIALILYAVISYIKIKRRVFNATLVRTNIFETDRIQTPFVMGFIKPRIYILVGINETEADYIIRHEQTHIKRADHLIKLLAFIGLALHWFNPLMWVSYFLMTKDMELSCDESVMKHSSEDIRANYSASLLSLSAKQSGLPNPLAFGESNVKSRIKNVLNFRKHSRLIMVMAVILAVTVTIGCAMNRVSSGSSAGIMSEELTLGQYTYGEFPGIEYSSISLQENNEFAFTFSLASSYASFGTYSIEDDKLILHDKSGLEFIFEIKDGELIFESEERWVKTGTIFKLYIDYENMSPQTAQNMLRKYLPAVIFDNLPDFKEEQTRTDGMFFWHWSAWDYEYDTYLHGISITMHDNGNIMDYRYYNNSFDGIPENNITKEQAVELIKEFAKDFIPNGENLNFENRPLDYPEYDPGKFEFWVARPDNPIKDDIRSTDTQEYYIYDYLITVNLEYGYINSYGARSINTDNGIIPSFVYDYREIIVPAEPAPLTANLIDFNISIQPEQYNENPFGGRVVNAIFRSKAEFEAYCGDEVYAVTATDGLGNENIYLRPLTETYDDRYFENKALVAVTFSNDIPESIYKVNRSYNQLTAWTMSTDTENKSDTRVFLIEVNKSDVAGFKEVYPGYDFAPIVIVDDPLGSTEETTESEESEFYTYDEYVEMMEKEKALFLSLIDCIDENWIPISGKPVLTQELYDNMMINWEKNLNETLEKIKNGEKIKKLPQHSYPYAVLDTLEERLDLKCRTENGKWILYNDSESIKETFNTKDDLLERARWWLSRAVPAGEIDLAQANYVYRNLYNTTEISSSPAPVVGEPYSYYPVFDKIEAIYIGSSYEPENYIGFMLSDEERVKLWELMRIDEWVIASDLPLDVSGAEFSIHERAEEINGGVLQSWAFQAWDDQILIVPSLPYKEGIYTKKICYFAPADVLPELIAFSETLTPFSGK